MDLRKPLALATCGPKLNKSAGIKSNHAISRGFVQEHDYCKIMHFGIKCAFLKPQHISWFCEKTHGFDNLDQNQENAPRNANLGAHEDECAISCCFQVKAAPSIATIKDRCFPSTAARHGFVILLFRADAENSTGSAT